MPWINMSDIAIKKLNKTETYLLETALVWYHKSPGQISGTVKMDTDPKIDGNKLLNVAATYVANPWLQHDQIDWIFIDSLIFIAISEYRESILTGQVTEKTNWPYIFAGGHIDKCALLQLKMALGVFALRYIIPPAIIAIMYFYFRYINAAIIIGGVYAIYLLLHTVTWPLRHLKRNAEEKIMKEHTERLKKMTFVYEYCRPPIISLSTLRVYLNKAVESGALFPGALFAILIRMEKTRGEAFMPFMESVQGI